MKPEQVLEELADEAIKRLKKLKQPVVRVSGPITSGGFGYDQNLKRFIKAQQVLQEKGLTVFDYFENNDDEQIIKSLNLAWEEVMKYYHDPILNSGLVATAYMLPLWKDSNGAKWEYDYFIKNNIEVRDFSENLFE